MAIEKDTCCLSVVDALMVDCQLKVRMAWPGPFYTGTSRLRIFFFKVFLVSVLGYNQELYFIKYDCTCYNINQVDGDARLRIWGDFSADSYQIWVQVFVKDSSVTQYFSL